MFTLVPVESNLTEEERDRLIERLRTDLATEGLSLRTGELTYKSWDPVEVIEKALGRKSTESLVLLVCGLERTPTGTVSASGVSRPPAFARLNQARELLEERYPVPTIVWCEPYTYGTLRRHAPDFFDHFSGLVRFQIPRQTERRSVRGRDHLPPKETARDLAGGASGAAAVRFYEERLEARPLSERERIRALLGLAETLVERRGTEGITALERAAESAQEARASLSPEQDLEAWSRANFSLARARGELGLPEAALAPAEEAVEGYRKLSAEEDRTFRAHLARALLNLSNSLAGVGRREEACEAVRETTEIFRELAAAQPEAFRPELALGLNNLSNRLANLERREEALRAIQESVALYRELAASRPETYRPSLARSLNNMSNRLADVDRLEEALEAIREAVALYRELAAARSEVYGPDLSSGLNNLSIHLADLGRREEALEATEEAMDILEPLFRGRPQTFASLMAKISRAYERVARASGAPADKKRLGSIRELLRSVEEAD